MEAVMSQDLQGEWPVGSPGELVVWFQSKGWLVKTQEEPMFQFKSKGRKRPVFQLEGSQAG